MPFLINTPQLGMDCKLTWDNISGSGVAGGGGCSRIGASRSPALFWTISENCTSRGTRGPASLGEARPPRGPGEEGARLTPEGKASQAGIPPSALGLPFSPPRGEAAGPSSGGRGREADTVTHWSRALGQTAAAAPLTPGRAPRGRSPDAPRPSGPPDFPLRPESAAGAGG